MSKLPPSHIDIETGLPPDAYRFAHEAMATVFEICICHPHSNYARQATYAAFDQLDRLEHQLSRFIENSDISQIAAASVNQPVKLSLETYECLEISRNIYNQTQGAFDPTIGSLMQCWQNQDKTLRNPSPDELNNAIKRTGMNLIELDPDQYTAKKLTEGVQLDLGGIAKGYAVDRMVELLNEWDIENALVHGGGSSVFAFGNMHETKGFSVTLSNPENRSEILMQTQLTDRALSGSGLEKGLHIIDPPAARPVKGKIAAWAFADNAAKADALSTAFMVMDIDRIEKYCKTSTDVGALIIIDDDKPKEPNRLLRFGNCQPDV